MGLTFQVGGGGYAGLASAILVRAVYDWRRAPNEAALGGPHVEFGSLEAELREFLEGPWCRELLEWIGCDQVGVADLLLREGFGSGPVRWGSKRGRSGWESVQRRRARVRWLVRARGWISALEVAKVVGCSVRTAQKDLGAVGGEYKRGKGWSFAG